MYVQIIIALSCAKAMMINKIFTGIYYAKPSDRSLILEVLLKIYQLLKQ